MADGRSDTAKLDDHDRAHGVGECNEGSCNPETAHEDDDCCADEECEAADPCVDDDCHSDGQTVSNDDKVLALEAELASAHAELEEEVASNARAMTRVLARGPSVDVAEPLLKELADQKKKKHPLFSRKKNVP